MEVKAPAASGDCRGKEEPGMPWVPDEGDRMRWLPCEGSIRDSESGQQARGEGTREEKMTGGDAGHGPEDTRWGGEAEPREGGQEPDPAGSEGG